MERNPRLQERRNWVRFNKMHPVTYIRFDEKGNPCDQKPSRSMNMSQGGVKLQSNFPVQQEEVLDLTMALEDELITFRGKVIYVIRSEEQGFEFGVAITDIDNQDKEILSKYFQRIRTH